MDIYCVNIDNIRRVQREGTVIWRTNYSDMKINRTTLEMIVIATTVYEQKLEAEGRRKLECK